MERMKKKILFVVVIALVFVAWNSFIAEAGCTNIGQGIALCRIQLPALVPDPTAGVFGPSSATIVPSHGTRFVPQSFDINITGISPGEHLNVQECYTEAFPGSTPQCISMGFPFPTAGDVNGLKELPLQLFGGDFYTVITYITSLQFSVASDINNSTAAVKPDFVTLEK